LLPDGAGSFVQASAVAGAPATTAAARIAARIPLRTGSPL
jgi:hypothetical protein